MILCEWDAPEGNPGILRTHVPVCFRILSSSLTSVSIFSVWCYSSVSISVSKTYREPGEAGTLLLAPLPGPAHVGAGGALGGQRTAAPAQALRRTRRTRVTLRKENY
jgi:hypothetical protein